MKAAVRIAILVTMAAVVSPSFAQTRSVIGQAGVLGEWELIATVTEQTKGQWAGSVSMKHVGFCSADGPEEKSGELRLMMSDPPGDVAGTLLIDGEMCTFGGRLADGYEGAMQCPNRRDVPMTLMLQ